MPDEDLSFSTHDGRDFDRLVAQYVDRLNVGETLDNTSEPLGTLGDYTLRRQIGRGGMGVVYEAWENSMDRAVALKVLPAGIAADTKACTRFMREAQTAGKLNHPNVVGVYSTGVKEGTPWYSMELVEGETLAQILAKTKDAESDAETPFGPKDQVGYFANLTNAFADVADGLQHAHSKGVVHRDVKPSNLILDGDGKLRILDFGLARLEGQESLTLSGDLMGTVLYMSPEQAMAKRIPLDHRTDVYSLGATMYEMLTSEPPFRGKDHHDTLSQIIVRDPRPPRQLSPRVPVDLETIVLKCLRKDPADRYGTAEALTQDFRRYVRGDPIEARPASNWERVVTQVRRHRTALSIGIAFALVVALAGWLALERYEAESRRRQAELGRKSLEYGPAVLAVVKKIYSGQFSLKVLGDRGKSRGAVGSEWFLRNLGLLPINREDFERLYTARGANPLAVAVEELRDIAKHLPDKRDAHYHVAKALQILEREGEASREMEQTLRCDPDFVPAKVMAWELSGRNAHEIEQLAAEYAHRDDWQKPWFEAYRSQEQGRWSQAAKAYQDLLDRIPDAEPYVGCRAETHLRLGVALLRTSDYTSASKHFVIADHRAPGFEPVLLLGQAYYLGGRKYDTERVFGDLFDRVDRDEKDEAALWIIAVYHSLLDYRKGLEWSEMVGDELGIKERVESYFHFRLGHMEEAIQAGRKATARNGEDLLAFLFLSWALYRDLAFSSGLERVRKLGELFLVSHRAVELSPDNTLAQRLVARATAELKSQCFRALHYLRGIPMTRTGLIPALLSAVVLLGVRTEACGAMTPLSYIGGSGKDLCRGAAVDHEGNVYLAAYTNSPDFPVPDGWDPVDIRGGMDVVVVKLSPGLDEILAVQMMGGDGDDWAVKIGVTDDGRVIVVGTATAGFPTEGNVLQRRYGGGPKDIFVAVLDSEDLDIEYLTLFGGSGDDTVGQAQIDPDGTISIVGFTTSRDFPVKNPYQSTFQGGESDTIVVQIRPYGNLAPEDQLVYSTYLGGAGPDHNANIYRNLHATEDGRISVVFNTRSWDLPIVGSEFQRALAGNWDAYVAILDPTSAGENQLVFSTYLGGAGFDGPRALRWTGPSEITIVGETSSTNFPATHRKPFRGFNDIFVTVLDVERGELVYSTTFGGRWWDGAVDTVWTRRGEILAGGRTGSPDFPLVNGCHDFQPDNKNTHGLLFLFRPGGGEDPGELRFSTSIGGPGTFDFNERINTVVEESPGVVLFAGETGSFQVPTTEGALQPEYGGGSSDIVIGRLVIDVLKDQNTINFLRGDCTVDGDVDLTDAVCMLDGLFGGAGAVDCTALLNTNGDDRFDLADPVSLLNFLFAGGFAPAAPFPDCGPGTLPADTELGCANPPNCQ